MTGFHPVGGGSTPSRRILDFFGAWAFHAVLWLLMVAKLTTWHLTFYSWVCALSQARWAVPHYSTLPLFRPGYQGNRHIMSNSFLLVSPALWELQLNMSSALDGPIYSLSLSYVIRPQAAHFLDIISCEQLVGIEMLFQKVGAVFC